MKQDLQSLRVEIQEKGLNRISQYFDLSETQLDKIDADVLKHLLNMAKLGMQFEREMNLARRANEMNYIRISKLVSDNREEMKQYLKKTMSQYFK